MQSHFRCFGWNTTKLKIALFLMVLDFTLDESKLKWHEYFQLLQVTSLFRQRQGTRLSGTRLSQNHRMVWAKDHLVPTPPPWGGTSSTRPGCSKPHSTWPWTVPGRGDLQLLWATFSPCPGGAPCIPAGHWHRGQHPLLLSPACPSYRAHTFPFQHSSHSSHPTMSPWCQ